MKVLSMLAKPIAKVKLAFDRYIVGRSGIFKSSPKIYGDLFVKRSEVEKKKSRKPKIQKVMTFPIVVELFSERLKKRVTGRRKISKKSRKFFTEFVIFIFYAPFFDLLFLVRRNLKKNVEIIIMNCLH